MRHQMRVNVKASGHCSQRSMEAMDERAAIRVDSFLDSWTMPLGVLGDYTAPMLLAFAEEQEEHAEGLRKNATFYRLLAAKVPHGEKLRQMVSNEAAWNLYTKIKGGARDAVRASKKRKRSGHEVNGDHETLAASEREAVGKATSGNRMPPVHESSAA